MLVAASLFQAGGPEDGPFMILKAMKQSGYRLIATAPTDPNLFTGMTPFIGCVVEHLPADALQADLDSHSIQTAVELRLQDHGLQIDNDDKGHDRAESRFVYVNVAVLAAKIDTPDPPCAYTITVQLDERVSVARTAFKTLLSGTATLWRKSYTGIAPRSRVHAGVDRYVAEAVDEFCNAYLKANPKK
jgi:hypothetical protein